MALFLDVTHRQLIYFEKGRKYIHIYWHRSLSLTNKIISRLKLLSQNKRFATNEYETENRSEPLLRNTNVCFCDVRYLASVVVETQTMGNS